MIVVDSSAIIAILLREADRSLFVAALAQSDRSCISSVNAYETSVVLRRRKGLPSFDLVLQFLSQSRIDIVSFDAASAKTAAAAYESYGKGIDPKAQLNLADCAAYALAKTLGAPLLFKGDDFAATDIKSVL